MNKLGYIHTKETSQKKKINTHDLDESQNMLREPDMKEYLLHVSIYRKL